MLIALDYFDPIALAKPESVALLLFDFISHSPPDELY
jgi:hypothetical protein